MVIWNESKIRFFIHWIKQYQYSYVTWWRLIEMNTASLEYNIYNNGSFDLERWLILNITYKSAAHQTSKIIQARALKPEIRLSVWEFRWIGKVEEIPEKNGIQPILTLLDTADQFFRLNFLESTASVDVVASYHRLCIEKIHIAA